MTTYMVLGIGIAVCISGCRSKPAATTDRADEVPGGASAETVSSAAAQITPPTSVDIGSPSGDSTVSLVDFPACRAAAAANRPGVAWAPDGYIADLTYDGSSEMVTWGRESDSLAVVSVVECVAGKPGRAWTFTQSREAFGTLGIQVLLINPAFGEQYLKENCMGAEDTPECKGMAALNTRLEAAYRRGGRGLWLGVPDEHGNHFYWDTDSSRFVVWGL